MGAKIVVVDIDEDRTKSTVESIQANDADGVAAVTDASNSEDVDTMTDIAEEVFGPAKALAEHDIRVNTLSPTHTGSRVGHEDTRSSEVPNDILVGRWGPRDQTNSVLFLVNPENAFVNGIELMVDCGPSA